MPAGNRGTAIGRCILLLALLVSTTGGWTYTKDGKIISKGQSGTHKEGKAMKVESPAFHEGEMIPKRYTCDGIDLSPPLKWNSVPEGTRSFVLIMDDPDAPIGTFTHWIIYDIPADINELEEGIPKADSIESVKQGMNDFGYVGYGGPCPPKGHGFHRYYFRIYALDVESLGLSPKATRRQVEERMKGHILGEGSIMGKYKRD